MTGNEENVLPKNELTYRGKVQQRLRSAVLKLY